ncbi:MAG: GSU2403 family nucleotidyltransferase fold protein [Clostridiales bacterium]
MNKEQKQLFWDTMKNLNSTGAFEHIMLIGSWVEYVYEQRINKFEAHLKTKDVDFLIKDVRIIKAKNVNINIPEVFNKMGFSIDVSGWGVMRFHKEGLLEVEFLQKEVGSSSGSEAKMVKELGLRTEALRNLEMLSKYSMNILLNGCNFQIPSPPAYIIHKMIVGRPKDVIKVVSLIPFVKANQKEFNLMKEIYNDLFKKQKRKVDSFIDNNVLDLDLK